MARSYGTAGGSLMNGETPYAKTAAAGAEGERRTAKVLDHLPSPIVVFHDLDIPLNNSDGRLPNIDHVIVVGKTVWLIDSKLWKPGHYRTVLGRTWLGWKRAPHADKQTLALAVDKLTPLAPNARFRCAMVVHSSRRDQPVNVRWFRPHRARALDAADLKTFASKIAAKPRIPDPEIVAALVSLLRK